MKRVRLVSAAEAEVDAALGWYRREMPHRLAAFADAIDEAVGEIGRAPESCALADLPEGAPEVRRAPLRGFPWGAFFVAAGDEISIIAVAHVHREPAYWLGRIPRTSG